MRKKHIISAAAIALLTLSSCGTTENQTDDVDQTDDPVAASKPAVLNSQGAVVIENGVVVEPVHNHESDATRVDMFMEPLCAACQVLEQDLSDTLAELNENGDIVIYSHPVSFMDMTTPEGYSSKAVSTMYGVAEQAPEYYLDYVEALYSDEYFPTEDNTDSDYLSDEHFVEVATSVGIDEEQAITAAEYDYTHYIEFITDHIEKNRPEINLDEEGKSEPGLNTPTVTVGGQLSDSGRLEGHSRVHFTGHEYEQEFLDVLAEYQD